MPRFAHRSQPLLVSTNYKVLYSTLAAQPSLQPLSEAQFARLALTGKHRHVMFVRNPYDRLQSAFHNKFRRSPAAWGSDGFRQWQRIQLRYLRFTGFQCDRAEDSAIRDALLAVPFEDFVNNLPRFWFRDAHLVPQYHRMRITMKWVLPTLPVRVDQLVRIEEMDPVALSEDLAIDLAGIRENASPTTLSGGDYTPALARVVQEVYRGDFERFGYSLTLPPR